MLEFQLLDVDYVIVNEKPIIRMFGKTASGESVCGFHEGFSPYFYTEGEEAKNLLKKEPVVVSIKEVERIPVNGYMDKKKVLKVVLQNPSKTPEIRERLHAAGIKTYEADILFKYRFMADNNIAGHDWIKVIEGNMTNTSTVNTRLKIDIKKFKVFKKEEDTPLKYLAFDIECVPIRSGTMPEAKKDPVIMISLVFSSPYKGKNAMVLSNRLGNGATYFETEKEMLKEFLSIVDTFDPDILTGYNLNDFDIPYMLERMRVHHIKPLFGRCNQKPTMARKIMSRHKISVVGRIIVDSFELIKKDFSLTRYGLDFVANALLGEKKEDVKKSEIEKLWKGSQQDFDRLVKYSEKDSILALNLVLKLNLIDKYLALARVSGVLLQDSLNSGETVRIENFLLREFNKQGFIYSQKPNQTEVDKREQQRRVELKGGFVIEPVKDLHSSVFVLDFKSMYPSIIISFNICPTTILPDNIEMKNAIKTITGSRFVPPEVRKGILPKILEELMVKRQVAKKKMSSATDKEKKRVLFAKQWALKIMANAIYGHTGYPRAKIYNLDIANTITACGRDTIHKTQEIIENKYKLQVVYGDTDSVMVKVDTEDMEEIKRIGNQISDDITKTLPGVIELEFEKIFKRFLPLAKKRYMAWKFELINGEWKDKLEMKGIETVRRDWCMLVSETTGTIIEIILKRADIKEAVDYFRNTVQELVKGNVDISKLIITKTMTRQPENYEGIQPHIELVKKIRARNPAESPGIGDRVGYVIVKGIGLLSKRAEDPDYIKEKGLQIDSQYYIENQLLPPLERIFNVLRVSKSELFGRGKQTSLFDIAKFNGNDFVKIKPPKQLQEISLDLVDGFICKICNKSYEIPPLIGTCTCGGEVLLSSPQGPVGRAIVG
ncbi:MAG: DNA-directed DNA polymerase [Nanoarchaeota archaeon]